MGSWWAFHSLLPPSNHSINWYFIVNYLNGFTKKYQQVFERRIETGLFSHFKPETKSRVSSCQITHFKFVYKKVTYKRKRYKGSSVWVATLGMFRELSCLVATGSSVTISQMLSIFIFALSHAGSILTSLRVIFKSFLLQIFGCDGF